MVFRVLCFKFQTFLARFISLMDSAKKSNCLIAHLNMCILTMKVLIKVFVNGTKNRINKKKILREQCCRIDTSCLKKEILRHQLESPEFCTPRNLQFSILSVPPSTSWELCYLQNDLHTVRIKTRYVGFSKCIFSARKKQR